jgi:hypothetical protein
VAVNDPHVEELVYHIETGNGLTFQDPPPVEDNTDAFRMILEDGVATFVMKEHYPTEKDARHAVEGYLQAWELDAALRYDSSELRFVFDRPKIVDRDPPPPPPRGTPQTVELEAAAIAVGAASVDLVVYRRQYPRPPTDFVADTDSRIMWEQYERYKQGRDRLLPMAYSCLTRLEHRARAYAAKGNIRMRAASMYRVDYEVLDKLGELATTLGDEAEARKLGPQSRLRAPTAQEVKWMEAALRLLIRRVGQYAADPQRAWPQQTMANLPDLT